MTRCNRSRGQLQRTRGTTMIHQMIPKRLTMDEPSATRNHLSDYADMVWGLEMDGYRRSMRLNEIDAEVIHETACEECGGDCRYEAYRRKEPRGYRALSVCRECGYVWEV